MNASLTRAGVPLLVTTIVAALLLALTGTAEAKESSHYRVSGRSASTEWTQIDGTAIGTRFGNVHIGWLSADQTSRGKAAVFGFIDDFDCEEGEDPGYGGHGDEPKEGLCDYVGSRFIEGFDVGFTMDKKLTAARLTGQLKVYGGAHGDEGVVGRPTADIVWTGIGDTARSSYTSRWQEGTTFYSDTYRSTERQATMSGNLGAMGFDPDLSSGYLSTYRASSQYRSR